MKNRLKMIIIYVIITLIFLLSFSIKVKADVGSFQSYSSGGSSGSSYSSGSSHTYSGYSGGSYYSSSGSSLANNGIGFVIVFVILVVYIIIKVKAGNGWNGINNGVRWPINDFTYNEKQAEEAIKVKDPNFDTEKFKSFAKAVFVKLQNAWTDRDWEEIRTFESNELFEQHKAQLDEYIKNNQINVMERICVNWVRLVKYECDDNHEILKVDLNSKMADYIIDAKTKELIKGDRDAEYISIYTLTFKRTAGILTDKEEFKVKTTNCPNCGAPTKITSSGKCEYCGSVITTGNYGWVLSNLERQN